MNNTLSRIVFLALLASGCSSVNIGSLLPFGEETVQDRTKPPANAAEFRCGGNKRFYVRNLDGGAVWLILPDRELRLEKAANGTSYGNGISMLDINGNDATFKDGSTNAYTGCKATSAN